MVSAYHEKKYSIDVIKVSSINPNSPMNLQEISSAAERIGFKSTKLELIYIQLVEEVHFSVIISWKKNDFAVLHAVKASFWAFLPWVNKEKKLIITDPKSGLIKVNKETFLANWRQENRRKGIALLLEPNKRIW